VLILGEQGAGKTEVAGAVARLNPRARPLQYKNAAGLISSVAAAELFGRKKGFLGPDDQGALGLFEPQIEGRCSSMKSASCRRIFKPNC